jgi:SnoaL-like polyketide cyclase
MVKPHCVCGKAKEMIMSTIHHAATRRSILVGAAAMLAPGAAAQSQLRGPYTIDTWKAAWANPSPERVMARIPLIATADIAGYWPRTTRPVRGHKEYAQRIVDLLTFIPDFRAELKEHAVNGDVMFVRWVAMGTAPNGRRFEAIGADRLLVPNGYVSETLVLSDHPIFAEFARHVGDLRSE